MILLLPTEALAAPPVGTYDIVAFQAEDQPARPLLEIFNADGLGCAAIHWSLTLGHDSVSTRLSALCPNMDHTRWSTCTAEATGPRKAEDGALVIVPTLAASTKIVHLVGVIGDNNTTTSSCNTSFGPLAGRLTLTEAGAVIAVPDGIIALGPATPEPDWQSLIPR